jgi:hypothetical protein
VGWTLNFGRPQALVFLGVFLFVSIFGPVFIFRVLLRGNKPGPRVFYSAEDTMAQTATTRNLVERLKAHDPAAVADLSDSYGAKIYQLAFRYLRNREDAEEVAQDVLLKVHQKIEAFRGDAALSSWIYRITFNAAMSRLREFKQHLPSAAEPATDEETDGR